jgi:hypothetical protein
MVVLPGETGVTTPVAASTVAAVVLLLDQVPPLFPLNVKFKVDAIQTDEPPLIEPAFKTGFTVIGADCALVPHEEVVRVYVIIAFPADTPLTTPDAAFTVATAVLLLLQLPPVFPLVLKVVDKPAQTDDAPVTVPAFGNGFTVIILLVVDVAQADETEYVIVVDPALCPATCP